MIFIIKIFKTYYNTVLTITIKLIKQHIIILFLIQFLIISYKKLKLKKVIFN